VVINKNVNTKIKKGKGEYIICKNGRKIDTETSKIKARLAASFYRGYFSKKK